ncbi:MAG: ESX-1 secretion-associated protein [Actinomycetia bacterium]|nr:ESX-1 secretion-associated protein [Actinomycetes bacterium]MCH9708159.1 ESX-1 secretion-associated protein [Actinomycetes bacterium]MCH9767133.1 ESX-1 secretion-associated protein [Actinomycetes bacterium]
MAEPLAVNTDGVRTLGDIHTRVAAGLGHLTSSAPASAEVAVSHGTIASGVNAALTAALGARLASISVTQSSAETLAELLHQAALAYERSDQRGTESIESAVEALGSRLDGSADPLGTE